METIQTTNRIHPLIAGAAVSVTLVSLLGAAAIAGLLPNSRGNTAPDPHTAATPAIAAPAPAATAATAGAAPVAAPLQTAESKPRGRTVTRTKVVYRNANHPAPQYAQNQTQAYPQQPVVQAAQPAVQAPAQQSMVGIATGAVIGGLLGNQVGGGNGKTLATVAGAIGGGYLGNEVGKKYGY